MKYEGTLERAVDLGLTHTRNLNAVEKNKLLHFFAIRVCCKKITTPEKDGIFS